MTGILCAFVSAPTEVMFSSHPGGGTRPPASGIAFAGVMDPYDPFVSIDVEYTLEGNRHVHRAQDITAAHTAGAAR